MIKIDASKSGNVTMSGLQTINLYETAAVIAKFVSTYTDNSEAARNAAYTVLLDMADDMLAGQKGDGSNEQFSALLSLLAKGEIHCTDGNE